MLTVTLKMLTIISRPLYCFNEKFSKLRKKPSSHNNYFCAEFCACSCRFCLVFKYSFVCARKSPQKLELRWYKFSAHQRTEKHFTDCAKERERKSMQWEGTMPAHLPALPPWKCCQTFLYKFAFRVRARVRACNTFWQWLRRFEAVNENGEKQYYYMYVYVCLS